LQVWWELVLGVWLSDLELCPLIMWAAWVVCRTLRKVLPWY
jgi:hypothetical protein